MARYIGPVCKLCRREGEKLYFKGERCYTDKCAIERGRPGPGQHGAKRGKLSDFGIQLREKQKLKRIYGMLERQFRTFFGRAQRVKEGKTGENLLASLETRLDSVVYKLGIAPSRNAARQFVRHNHININGKRCNIPSAVIKVGDKISVAQGSREVPAFLLAQEAAKREGHGIPAWLSWDASTFTGELKAKPTRDQFTIPVREQLVVELYSK